MLLPQQSSDARSASLPEAKPSVFMRDAAALLLLPPAFRQFKQAGDMVQPLASASLKVIEA